MPATLVNSGNAGQGQTVQVSSLSFTIPTVVTGDRLIVYVNSSDSAMVFSNVSGATVKDGPRANSTNQATAVLEKILTAADSGTTFTVAWSSGAARATLQWSCWNGTSGTSTVAVAQDAAATATFTLPTIGSVAAGSLQLGVTLRRRSGAAANFTNVPAGYTANTEVATTYGTGINVFGRSAYILSSGSGTVGGESFTTGGVTSLGTNYLIVIPTGPPTQTADLSMVARAGLADIGGVNTVSGVVAKASVAALIVTGRKDVSGIVAAKATPTLSVDGVRSQVAVLGVKASPALTLSVTGAQSAVWPSQAVPSLVIAGRKDVSAVLAVKGTAALVLGGFRTTSGILVVQARASAVFTAQMSGVLPVAAHAVMTLDRLVTHPYAVSMSARASLIMSLALVIPDYRPHDETFSTLVGNGVSFSDLLGNGESFAPIVDLEGFAIVTDLSVNATVN